MVTIEKLTIEHIKAASEFIRQEDRREWVAGRGLDVEDCLTLSDPSTGYARAALDGDGNVLCFWGVDDAWVWLAATTFGQRQWRSLIRMQEELLADIRQEFPARDIRCFADDRNTLHHLWLKRLGFVVTDHVFLGPWQLPFTYYELKG